jgi:GIY-YIG catalytic domain
MVVYEVTCLADGRRYIGSTTRLVALRWESHCIAARGRPCASDPPLIGAIRKHGEARFTLREVACARTERELRAIERVVIQQEGTAWPVGFNADSQSFSCGVGSHWVRAALKAIDRERGAQAAIAAARALSHLAPARRRVRALEDWWAVHRPRTAS